MQKKGIFIIVAFVIAALAACENPVNSNNVNESGLDSGSAIGSGTLTIDGTDYELSKFYIDHVGYSNWNDNYEIDLRIFTEEVSFDGNTNSGTNNGYGVYFDMFYSDNNVTAGSYPYNEDENDNTFSSWSYAFGPDSYPWEFRSGTIDITVSGDTFSITGSGTVENGDTVQFDYEGPVTEEFSTDS